MTSISSESPSYVTLIYFLNVCNDCSIAVMTSRELYELFVLLLFVLYCFVCNGEVVGDSSNIVELHEGWKACRVREDAIAHGCQIDAAALWNVSRLPTTALAVLIENGQFTGQAGTVQMDDLYFSMNLALFPDIHEVGRRFYTLLYEIEIEGVSQSSLHFSKQSCGAQSPCRRQILRFAGINYRATAWLDGVKLPELNDHQDAKLDHQYPGMFRRRSYDVAPGGRFTILIEPPDHPGQPIPAGGQGGNHELAMDGAVPQYMLGWDWCQAMPDRATGFYGSVTLEALATAWSLRDVAIQTISLQDCLLEAHSNCSKIVLWALARIEGGPLPPSASMRIETDWGETWLVSDTLGPDVQIELVVQNPEAVRLWWPHGVGIQTDALQHIFTFTLSLSGIVVDVKTIPVGIRTIETRLDPELQGQRFQVNGQDIYLVGGNWIGTDQALRFSASSERYCSEIALHRHAGLNLIRVWGGGTAERDQFYDCADRLGVLVYQEFWMTGDNNGRWAGNFSWPLDYNAYLANVEDTILRLRRHASLLFYGGCNECLAPRNSTWFPNPPYEVNHRSRSLLEQFDPGRFYIPSSMGGVRQRYLRYV
jgi:mannosylglycoprotein endo-beta-mannosidase